MEKPKIKLSEMSQKHLNQKLTRLSDELADMYHQKIVTEFEGESFQFVLDNLSQTLLHSFTGMLFDLYAQVYHDDLYESEQERFIEFVLKNTEFKLKNFFNSAKKLNEEDK